MSLPMFSIDPLRCATTFVTRLVVQRLLTQVCVHAPAYMQTENAVIGVARDILKLDRPVMFENPPDLSVKGAPWDREEMKEPLGLQRRLLYH
ncbi:MAG: hypothetical protein SGPRY_005379 [Prymnesium sp.]